MGHCGIWNWCIVDFFATGLYYTYIHTHIYIYLWPTLYIYIYRSDKSSCQGKINTNTSINSLWPSDAMWRPKSGSTLAQFVGLFPEPSLSWNVFFGIHKAISQVLMNPIRNNCSGMTLLKLLPRVPGTNEITYSIQFSVGCNNINTDFRGCAAVTIQQAANAVMAWISNCIA